MEPNTTYRNLSIVLAIIALIFIVLYFTKPSEPVSETFSDMNEKISSCQQQLIDWRSKYSAQSTSTEQSRSELDAILDDCQDIFEDSQEQI
jgi:hypothetical protein